MTIRKKYPRTRHLPWSSSITNDDRILDNLMQFNQQMIVVTEKMDGENTSLYNDYHFHARSIDSGYHESRSHAKSIHAAFAHIIPENWRVCCENVFAKHSIHYKDLKNYLYGICIWNEQDICLSWDKTEEWFDTFDLPTVPVLYTGMFDIDAIREIEESMDFEKQEGYVVRLYSAFTAVEFSTCVGKYVREGHVQTDEHWTKQPITPNELK